MVREIESPYQAAPVVIAPKKDETGQWTNLRHATSDCYRLKAVTIRDSVSHTCTRGDFGQAGWGGEGWGSERF